MINESYTAVMNNTVFSLARLNKKKELLVFFHGIGDSHLNFECFFHEPRLNDYDLFIADLLGHGYSSSSNDYSFHHQCIVLKAQLDKVLERGYEKIVFVPHSMGGVHAIELLSDAFGLLASGIVALDTTVSEYKSFIAKKVEEVIASGADFNTWFDGFCDHVFKDMATEDDALRRYFAGLMMVRKEAFKSNALELRKIVKSPLAAGNSYVMGEKFVNLKIPKIFCTTQNDNEDAQYLRKKNVPVFHFNTSSHWIAQACPYQFCDVLIEFMNKL